MTTSFQPGDRLLTPAEVATMFRVKAKTVTNWHTAGRLAAVRTPGGHRRFPEAAVLAFFEETTR